MIINPSPISVELDDSVAQFQIVETLQGFSIHLVTLPFECRIKFRPQVIEGFGRFGKDQQKEVIDHLNYWQKELREGRLFETLPAVIFGRIITGASKEFEKFQEGCNE